MQTLRDKLLAAATEKEAEREDFERTIARLEHRIASLESQLS